MSGPPIFIVGCPRSGTSLLRDLLRSHPSISIPPESHFIPGFYSAWGDPRTERDARALGRRILSLRMIRRWKLDLEPADFASARSFAEAMEVLFGQFARLDGKPRWGDKTPHYVESLPLLNRVFPEARFIHIYRDGRDVASSWVRTDFSPGNVYRAARAWRRMVSAGRRDGTALGDRYLEVRYESLLEHPAATMREVCDFLDEPFDQAVTRRAERPLVYGFRQMRRPAEIDPSVAGKWRRQMPVADRALVESVAGDLLAELGYENEGQSAPIPLPGVIRMEAGGRLQSGLNRVRGQRLSMANWLLELRALLLAGLRQATGRAATREQIRAGSSTRSD